MINNKYIADFLNYLKKIKGCKNYAACLNERSLTNLTHISETSINLYESGVPFRTGKQKYIKGVGNYLPVLKTISGNIYRYFNKNLIVINKTSFDHFHYLLCIYFVTELNRIRKANGAQPLTYGNAQKFINMLFKYLACFKDYKNFSNYFEFCHMPIDSVILDPNHLEKLGVKDVKDKKFRGYSWTQIPDQRIYEQLVREYRKVIKISPLQYDFENW